PPHDEMIRYIDMFRDRFGVEPICRVLGATARGFLTSRGYRAAKTRPASERSHRDAALVPVVKDLHQANSGVYWVRKMWHAIARPASDRSHRDAALLRVVKDLHQANYGVYWVRKMCHAMARAGWDVGRDQVARLMRLAGISGVVRGRKPQTTIAAKIPDHRP